MFPLATIFPLNVLVPVTIKLPPAVNDPVPVVIGLLFVVFRLVVPVPDMSNTVEFPARVIAVELIVVRPEPVVNVFAPEIVVLPVIVMPLEPAFRLIAVAPVVLPTVIIFALELVPILIAPVVPESKINAPVVLEMIFRAYPAADMSESVLLLVIDVAPLPVNIAELVSIENLAVLFVIKFSP